ncbi:MAG TPA: hypothetical protein VM305_01915 [Candidatus Limnocylindrales bacterium]|nr:hypothetical protein [Candidatus Limnocylindrales bacterium]
MTKKNATSEMRRCIGSKTFGIEPHEAPVADFPAQPSQKDGLGRMCKPHWRQYTNALRKAALARKAVEAPVESDPAQPADRQEDKKAEVASTIRALATGKPATKRERRRTPMAHLPSKGGDHPPEAK